MGRLPRREVWDFGDYGALIRAAAGWDPSRYAELWRTPLREVCLAATKRIAGEQMTHYLLSCLLYAQGGLKKEPEPPTVSKGIRWLL